MLNGKRAQFVREYLVDLNATQAAIRAGYSKKTAYSAGGRLLKDVEIADEIARLQAERLGKLEITATKVVEELAKIGFANMQDYMRITLDGDPALDFSNLTRAQAAALCEVTVEDFKDGRGEDARDVRRIKFKLADKRAALVDLGRYLGLFKDKVEHSGTVNVEQTDARKLVAGRIAGIASRIGTASDPQRPNGKAVH